MTACVTLASGAKQAQKAMLEEGIFGIGMGATLHDWSDRYPATLINVFKKGSNTYIEVQMDSYTRVDDNGMSENQVYEFERNTEGSILTFKAFDKGWVQCYFNEVTKRFKASQKGCGYRLTLGRRERYYDFSF